ncbi:PaaI family thioesterase [Streptomyces sp. NPDC058247]|uniref:PaaI family thioesterase n=1 Tax=Streptomyces sp. NPDC058247 TaxID=3346401 RepID=UPI0036E6332C
MSHTVVDAEAPTPSEGPDRWKHNPAWATPDATAFAEILGALRRVQSAAAFSAPPAALTSELIGPLEEIADHLAAHRTGEDGRLAGGSAVGGPGHPLFVPYEVTSCGARTLRASVEFEPVHVGGNGAVHGGVLPLLFDDVLGVFVAFQSERHCRTAYLHVNYRKVTPIRRPLRIDAAIDRVEGRKTYVTGRLYDGETLLADVEALFVQLLPGQP